MIENIFNLSTESILFLRSLRAEPTPERWREELLSIYRGERDQVIENVGSTRQYILRLCADATHSADCRRTFVSVLSEVVEEWLPEQSDDRYNLFLLELIQHFRPTNGATRILSYLLPGNSIWFSSGSDSRSLAHTKAALAALESSWKFRPASVTDPTFGFYARLLRKHLEESLDKLAPHCFRRLLELRQLDLSRELDRELAKNAIGYEGVLEELLQYGLGIHQGLLEDQIGDILALSLAIRTESSSEQPYFLYAIFVETLRRLGASIVEYPHNRPVAIQLNDGSRILLDLPRDSRTDYEQASSYDADLEFSREWGPLSFTQE